MAILFCLLLGSSMRGGMREFIFVLQSLSAQIERDGAKEAGWVVVSCCGDRTLKAWNAGMIDDFLDAGMIGDVFDDGVACRQEPGSTHAAICRDRNRSGLLRALPDRDKAPSAFLTRSLPGCLGCRSEVGMWPAAPRFELTCVTRRFSKAGSLMSQGATLRCNAASYHIPLTQPWVAAFHTPSTRLPCMRCGGRSRSALRFEGCIGSQRRIRFLVT